MAYMSDDGTIIEFIYNSRDGVTPFCVLAKDGKTPMTHVDWHRDMYTPSHTLQDGDRFFTTHTEQTALDKAKEFVEYHWESGMSKSFNTKTEAIEHFAEEWTGTPTIATWGKDADSKTA